MAQSVADRVAAHVAKRNEIGEIPPIVHPALRERCKNDLALFGWIYCRKLLDHQPSEEFKRRIVDKIQAAILHGGQVAVEALRGGGKTTWFTIAAVWGILYGHIKFPAIICAAQQLAKNLRRSILSLLEDSQMIADDFPAVAKPLRMIGGIAQRGISLTYNGKPTGFISTEAVFRLPNLKDAFGQQLDFGCGAIIAVRGVDSTIRGLNVDGVRPDFALLDDPQTQKDARSNSRCQVIEEFIHSDVLGLASNTSTISAFVAITPQRYGDLAHRIFDKSAHANWVTSVCPAILQYCKDFEILSDEFIEVYQNDIASEDFARTSSRAWYRANKARFDGTVMLDPLAFDKANEEDALHHALVKMASVGKIAFAAEYQMQVEAANAELALTPEIVSRSFNGSPMWTMPPNCEVAVAACDVNLKEGEGLSWVVVGFGRKRVAAVIAYGRYPRHGRLIPKDASQLARQHAVVSAIDAVVKEIASHKIKKPNGKCVNIRALAFDRGFMADVVCNRLRYLRHHVALPFQLTAMRGAGWKNYGTDKRHALITGDNWAIYTNDTYGDYLEFNSPYWKEIMQSGFLETPLLPGSLSLFGIQSQPHWQFAVEVSNERLVRKYTHPSGKTAWDWIVNGANHFGDALTNAFALASCFKCYEPLPKVLNAMTPVNADLFDPRLNAAVNANAAAEVPRNDAGKSAAVKSAAVRAKSKPRARFAAPMYKRKN